MNFRRASPSPAGFRISALNAGLKVKALMLEITTATEQVIFWLILTFVLGGTLIIINALQMTIFNRKKEIAIMKMVGADDWFIRSPYIVEGIFYALSSTILSAIMLKFLAENINLTQTISFTNIFLLEILATTIIGILSALVTIEEYLQKDLQA